MNLGGAALNKLKQFFLQIISIFGDKFQTIKRNRGYKKNKRHAYNMNAFVFVLPCKACLLPFTEQRALSWVWSPHSPQTRHFISFLQYKRCLFLLKKYFLQDIQDKDRQRDRPLYIIFTRKKIPFLLQSKGRHYLSKNICLTRPTVRDSSNES